METELPAINRWSRFEKLIFRVFALYLLLYMVPVTFANFIWDGLVDIVAEHVLQLSNPITVKPNGSGDTTYNYVQLLGVALLATAGSITWTIADRKRLHYDKLLYWLLVVVRYYLALSMISYGFAKIFQTQFLFPDLRQLVQPIGESSPMGLAWTFMGYSTGYNLFTGISEALGGFFLLFRRTATLGALLSIAVLANIVALNFFFDIPAKLFSSHLLLMAIFVALPDIPRLIKLFFLNKPVPATVTPPPFRRKWMQITRVVLKVLIISFCLFEGIYSKIQLKKYYGNASTRPAMYGIYKVTSFEMNGQLLPPLTTDSIRWNTFIVSNDRYVTIKAMNDSIREYSITLNSDSKKFLWSTAKGSIGDFSYHTPDSTALYLHGKLNNDTVNIFLKRIDHTKFRLVSRGFNWINEYPYNR